MATRFPVHEVDDAQAVEKLEAQLIHVHGSPIPFTWKDQNGEMLGPYGPLLHAPHVTPGFWSMAAAVSHPTSVKPRNRELAILAVCSVIDAAYVRHWHRKIAAKYGLTDIQYDMGLTGQTPEGLTEEEEWAFAMGRKLATLRGPLDDAAWNDAIEKLGKHELLGVTHIVGAYVYVCMLANLNSQAKRWS